MATETVTPNLDAALDASTVIAAGAEAPIEVDESSLSDLDILNQEEPVAPPVEDKPAEEVKPAEAAKPAEEKTEAQKAEEAKAAKPEEVDLSPADKAVKTLKDSI